MRALDLEASLAPSTEPRAYPWALRFDRDTGIGLPALSADTDTGVGLPALSAGVGREAR